MGTYADADALRAALGGLGEEVLPDEEANRLIELAEDRIDSLLEGTPEAETGRIAIEDDVEDWQWAKLGSATARLAARFYEEPEMIHDQRWASVSGELTASGPLGEVLGPAVLDPLRASGLLSRPTSSRRLRRHDESAGRVRSPQGEVL